MIKVELLEYLQLQCNCEYLSDLKYSPYWLSRLRAMKRPEQFTVEEWNQALEYLNGQPVRCQTLREVQAYLARSSEPEKQNREKEKP